VIKSLPLFLLVLLSSLSVFGQVELPLVKAEFVTEYKNGEISIPRKIRTIFYGNDRIERIVSVDQDSAGKSYLETWTDLDNKVIMFVFGDEFSADTLEHFYLSGKPWMDVVKIGGGRSDTTLYVYADDRLMIKKYQSDGRYDAIDSLFYADTMLIKTVKYWPQNKLSETIYYQYNTKKGLIYQCTSKNPLGEVTSLETTTYTSQRKNKSYKFYAFNPSKGKNVIDNARFYKYNYEGLLIKKREYDYLTKTVKKTIFEYDAQDRIIRSVTTSPSEKCKTVTEIEYQ
jgi:hypothetical protein